MNIKVFIIEDEALTVESIQEMVKSFGDEVVGFTDTPDNAIEMIKNSKPDIVLLDINLRGKMEGLDLSRSISTELKLPVIFITGYSEESIVNNAIKNSPYAYLVKPIKQKELEIAIKLTCSHFQLERAIQRQKEWFEGIVDFSGSIILIITADQKVWYINRTGCEILGYKNKEEIIGKNWFDNFIPVEIRESLRTLFINGLKVGEKRLDYFENEVLTRAGEKRLIAWNNRLFYDEANNLKGYICTGEDITEKRSIEENLLLTFFAVESAGDGIVWIDETGKIEFINRAAAEIIGHKPLELLEKSFPSFLLIKNADTIDKFIPLIKSLETLSYEVLVWNASKGPSFYRVRANVFYYKKMCYVFFHIHDITIEVSTREELRILSMAVEQSPVATIVTDQNGKIRYVNQAFTEITGYSIEEIVGKTPSVLKSGFQNAKDYRVLWKTILNGKIWRGVFQNRKKNGDLFWVKATIFPIFDHSGKIVHFIAEEEDITEEKIAKDSLQKTLVELERLNRELDLRVEEELKKNLEREKILIQQSRLAAMGEMLGNIAHQWRQPLNAVGILLQNLYFNYRNGKLTEEYFENTVNKTMNLLRYMSKTIDDFRNFFKPDREVEKFYVSDVIKKSVSLLKDSFEAKGIKIHIHIKDEIIIEGYQNQLGQVILNILGNAHDALIEKDVKNPRVDVTLEKLNGKANIRVFDNGEPIPEEIMDKIFEPYFTTKQQGSGIGLYMSKIIIENYFKGKLSAHNLKDGVEFIIELKI
ncbi:MAG: PAS domain S-box protein [Brevinematia bacterium]